MQARRFERFDPVTVRAAARVIRVGRLGRVSPAEVRCFLQHLADLHPGQGIRAVGRLHRLARWRASLGDRGVPPKFHMRRATRLLPSRGVSLVRSERTPR
jgi:hypothetical protein